MMTKKIVPALFFLLSISAWPFTAVAEFTVDTIQTAGGNLEITFIGHSSLIFSFEGQVIHIDPFGKKADYSVLPKADIALITHDHYDHLDPEALGKIRTPDTMLILTKKCTEKVKGGTVMRNGEKRNVGKLLIEAVPAYNLVHKRDNDEPFHPKGIGNGYVITFADKRIYVAGDTENIPEMKELKNIDIAFLPMNLPYTMTPEMVADAARAFKPKALYPYHYGDTETNRLIELLKDAPEIEVRIR